MIARLTLLAALLTNPWGIDLQNHPVPTLAPPGTRAVVLFFLATDCPISDRYQPTIARLAHQFERDHIAMYTVYPNPAETASAIRTHQLAFAQTLPALRDPAQALVHLTGARTTPEAAILLPTPSGLRLAYLGRIDDRYLTLGTQRPAPTHNDLALALQATLANTPIPQPTGPPVGCSIIPLAKPRK